MKRWILHSALILVLASCSKNVDELKDETPVVVCILEGGQQAGSIRLFTLGESLTPVQDASLQLSEAEGESVSLVYGDEGYAAEGFIVGHEKNYTLSGNARDVEFSGTCVTPPDIQVVALSDDTLAISNLTLPALVFLMNWTVLDTDKYSYMLSLEVLEEDPVAIPFMIPSGKFSESFNGPQEAAAAVIYNNDFRYYGHHRIHVYAIDKEYEQAFFYVASDIRGLLKNGPDNILGAKGFMTGVSSFTIDLWIE